MFEVYVRRKVVLSKRKNTSLIHSPFCNLIEKKLVNFPSLDSSACFLYVFWTSIIDQINTSNFNCYESRDRNITGHSNKLDTWTDSLSRCHTLILNFPFLIWISITCLIEHVGFDTNIKIRSTRVYSIVFEK